MKLPLKNFVLCTILVAGIQSTYANSITDHSVLRCDFLPGFWADWKSGNPEIRKGGFDGPILFDSINLSEGTARMIGNAGAPPLRLFATRRGITLLESMDGDVVVVTTIFEQHPGGDPSRYSAVHSRHKITGSQQYHGICTAQ